ncbi:MAG: PAS domain-containing protein [Pseudomonadota bacterium]|nr:PAS domain-containing protein [Pseudomonadota bacterium]
MGMAEGTDYPVPGDEDDPRFRFFWDFWNSRRTDGRLPPRAILDPLDLRPVLGNLNIIAVERDGDRLHFVYRLWGTRIAAIYGCDLTGKYLGDAATGDGQPAARAVHEEVARTGRPHYWRRPLPLAHRGYVGYRRLLLPFAKDGETVDHLVALLIGDEVPR